MKRVQLLLTRSIAHSRIKRRPNDPNIKWHVSVTQAFDVVQMSER